MAIDPKKELLSPAPFLPYMSSVQRLGTHPLDGAMGMGLSLLPEALLQGTGSLLLYLFPDPGFLRAPQGKYASVS